MLSSDLDVMRCDAFQYMLNFPFAVSLSIRLLWSVTVNLSKVAWPPLISFIFNQ